jgi:hypothetical protein
VTIATYLHVGRCALIADAGGPQLRPTARYASGPMQRSPCETLFAGSSTFVKHHGSFGFVKPRCMTAPKTATVPRQLARHATVMARAHASLLPRLGSCQQAQLQQSSPSCVCCRFVVGATHNQSLNRTHCGVPPFGLEQPSPNASTPQWAG